MRPLISIVTTLYNYARFIPDLADSVLAQTWKNWEWIIVDDASDDNPLGVLQSYIEACCTMDCGGVIRYIRQPQNLGYSAAKNKGIRVSGGDFIVMIDADDILTQNSLEIRYDALAPTDKLWVHGEVVVKNGDQLSDESRKWKRKFRQSLIKEGYDLEKEYHHRLIHAQSVMVRRELHKKVGLYDPKLRFSSDNEMWRRIIGFGHIPVHIEQYVAVYRVHPNRMARSGYKKQRVREVKRQILQDVDRRVENGVEAELLWE